MSDARTILLIGYQGRRCEDFLQALLRAGATTLVDVRRRALSRKKGFSKNGLRAFLESNGIKYRHFPDLGPPVEVLRGYRRQGDWARFRAGYLAHVVRVRTVVRELERLASTETVCLMCMEADAARCHRSLLVRSMLKRRRSYWTVKSL